jgi:hypothetical protein
MAKKPDPLPEIEPEIDETDEDLDSVAEAAPREVRKSPRRPAKRKKDLFDAQEIRNKSREFLDLLRSFVTVAVICYAASKSTAWYLWGFATAAKLALAIYALSYVINGITWVGPKRPSKWIVGLLSLAFVLAAYLALHAVFSAVNITIDHLIRTRT